ncbi:hypothetical protein [Pseudorhodoplanes sinuspersici]|uniref:hypothetical protein n=1 Tax=Pseudorhodoplanes sinuspersici TaxID=1235591 RepID=UPI000A3270F0|nr:hypothetical protein [Pseudorhodoplanes sinuspersici]RKE68152.1 hypothetical protein DFP91_4517 [Pseudorhodoplanes sinuspersici]
MTDHDPRTEGHEPAPLTQDEFDNLVDDATHAVNNLIPDHLLDEMSDRRRSSLLIEINDALTAILREYFPSDR